MNYELASPVANKMLNPDGGIVTFSGAAANIADAAPEWQNAAPVANKLLNPDGSVSLLSDVLLSGGGTGDHTHFNKAILDGITSAPPTVASVTAAQNTANTAQSTANAAEGAANAAQNTADGAVTAAGLAQTAAGNAQAAADSAAVIAGQAQTIAGNALTTAQAAQTTADSAIPLSQKGAASGVAPLGVDGIVPALFLPAASTGNFIDRDEIGADNGVAPLDGDGKVPAVHLPTNIGRDFIADPIETAEIENSAVTDTIIGTRALTDEAGESSLVAINPKNLTTWLQRIRNNLKHLIDTTDTQSTDITAIEKRIDDIDALIAGLDDGGTIADWNTLINKPAEFPPSAHTHLGADITDIDFDYYLTEADIEDFATGADVTTAVTAHNNDATAHGNIRGDINTVSDGLTTAQGKIGDIEDNLTLIGEDITDAKADIAQNAQDINDVAERVDSLENLGHYLGAVDTEDDLPAHSDELSVTPTINDFMTVREDGTQGGAVTRYVISQMTNSGDILWNYDVSYSTDITGAATQADINNSISAHNASNTAHSALFDNTIKNSIPTIAGDVFEYAESLPVGIHYFRDQVSAPNQPPVAGNYSYTVIKPTANRILLDAELELGNGTTQRKFTNTRNATVWVGWLEIATANLPARSTELIQITSTTHTTLLAALAELIAGLPNWTVINGYVASNIVGQLTDIPMNVPFYFMVRRQTANYEVRLSMLSGSAFIDFDNRIVNGVWAWTNWNRLNFPVAYSANEQDTGQRWTDGKPIYRRVFTGNRTQGAGTGAAINLGVTDIENLIAYGGWWQIGNAGEGGNTVKYQIGQGYLNNEALRSSFVQLSSSNALQLYTISDFTRTNAPYSVWVEYTKA